MPEDQDPFVHDAPTGIPHAELSLPQKLKIAAQLLRDEQINGNLTNVREQLFDLGPYALPVLLEIANELTHRQAGDFMKSLVFGLTLDLPKRSHTRTLDRLVRTTRDS